MANYSISEIILAIVLVVQIFAQFKRIANRQQKDTIETKDDRKNLENITLNAINISVVILLISCIVVYFIFDRDIRFRGSCNNLNFFQDISPWLFIIMISAKTIDDAFFTNDRQLLKTILTISSLAVAILYFPIMLGFYAICGDSGFL